MEYIKIDPPEPMKCRDCKYLTTHADGESTCDKVAELFEPAILECEVDPGADACEFWDEDDWFDEGLADDIRNGLE